jgi:outer membrane protein OmpA-like peptidoglycan-associated protein
MRCLPSFRARRLLGVAGFALLASTSATASAQPRASVDRLEPAPAGEPFATVASPAVDGRLRLAAGVLVSYANRPLVLRTEGPGAASLDWVGYQATLHALASVELARRVKLEVDAPFVLAEGGDSGAIANGTYAAPSGAHLGDVRVGGRVLVLRQAGALPAAAVGFTGWIPTGDPASFSGAFGPSFGPSVLVGAGFEHFLWSATLAERFQARADENLVGSQTVLGLAAAARAAGFSLGPEARLAFANGAGPRLEGSSASAGAEILGVARYGVGPVALSAGAGGSLGSELGAPRYRLFASLAVAHDLLSGPTSACPFAPAEPRAAGVAAAPEASSARARSTAVAPVAAVAAPAASAAPLPPPPPPPDRDGDGVADRDDRCPDEPGAPSLDATRDGCPPDTDGDGIVDAKDACPRERGAATADAKTSGCPAAVRVEGQQIVILQQVNFETGRDVVAASSFDLLAQIAAVMSEHPDLARVAVDGHTDGVGAEKQNLALSQRRAVAVVRWLVEHGVDARRLEARGFGPRRPLADDKTEAGRAKNRRVEFQIRRRTPDGAAGWRDGPVD